MTVLRKVIIFSFFLAISFLNSKCYGQEKEDLIDAISYTQDFDKKLTIQTISSTNFTKLEDPKLGYKNGTYWFKALLKPFTKGQLLVFEIEGNTIDEIEIFSNQKKIATINDKLETANLTFEVLHKTKKPYYFKVHFQKQVLFPLKVYNQKTYFTNQQLFYFKNGLYYGFVLVVLVVNLFFYFTLKDKTFLTYFVLLALTNIGITDFDSFMSFYTEPSYRYYISLLVHLLMPISLAIFTSSILNFHILVPTSKWVFTSIIALAAILYLVFMYNQKFIYAAIADILGVIICCYAMYLSICQLKKQKIAWFIVLGYSFILIAGTSFLLPFNWGFSMSLNIVKFGAIFEMIILTAAIMYRVKMIQKENILFSEQIKNYINKVYDLEKKSQKNNKTTTAYFEKEKIIEISQKHKLTVRETEILIQISKGLNNKQIADELFISINTVKYHIRNLYEKLDIKKRIEVKLALS
jgi:DNA-binding CsgD family transcriptional regulator